jgi:hypothetical protein
MLIRTKLNSNNNNKNINVNLTKDFEQKKYETQYTVIEIE